MLTTNQDLLSFIQQENHPHIKLKSYTTGAMLITQGQKGKYVYLINQGIIKCSITEENGKDYILAFLGKGEILGEIEAIKNIDNLCNVQALTAVDLYTIPVNYFLTLLHDSPLLSSLLLKELSSRLIQTSSRSSFQQLYPTANSLQKLIDLSEQQGIKLSKQDMAAYLGITIRSLNRTLKEIE